VQPRRKDKVHRGGNALQSPIAQERMRGLCAAVLLKPCPPDVIASHVRSLVDAEA
jgi:hypothetical protein